MNQAFLEFYQESVAYKDKGMLASAIEKRRQATAAAHNIGWRALGKAYEAILLGVHIGDGIAAYAAAKECLENAEDFHTAAEEWYKVTGFSVFDDLFNMITQWSESYDACIKWNRLREQLSLGTDILQSIEIVRQQEPEWWRAQLVFAYNCYSRERPEMDAGQYGQGMSILQCILRRGLDDEPGYNFGKDGMEHMLQDYIWIAHRHSNEVLLPKYQLANGQGTNPPKNEILIVLRNVLKLWEECAPDIPIQKEEIKKFYPSTFQMYWLDFAVYHAQDELQHLQKYYPNTMKSCPDCGKEIPIISPVCRYCGKMFQLKGFSPKSKGGAGCLITILCILGVSSYMWYRFFALNDKSLITQSVAVFGVILTVIYVMYRIQKTKGDDIMFNNKFDPSQPLAYDKAEKLARDIVVQIVETSRMLLQPHFLGISPAQKMEIAKCALKTFGKVKGEQIEERIDFLLSQVKIIKK